MHEACMYEAVVEMCIYMYLTFPPFPSLSMPPPPPPHPQERLQAVAQESLQMERDQLEREVRRLHRDVKEWKVTTEHFGRDIYY